MNIERAEKAKKYAQAFLNLSLDSINIDMLPTIKQLYEYLKAHDQQVVLLTVPLLSAQKKQDILWQLCMLFHMPSSFLPLIVLLVEHRLIDLLSDVLEQIIIEYKKRKNIEDFVITSSMALSLNQQQALQAFIEGAINKVIMIRMHVDKRLIAGICIQSDTLRWEYSINKHCRMIKKSFGLKDAYGY